MLRRAACASLLAAGMLGAWAGTAHGAGPGPAPASRPRTAAAVTGPVFDSDAPDPDVIRVGTTYFAYTTGSDLENIPVLTSTDLQTWVPLGDALPALPSWQVPLHTWGPGVLFLGGRYVMYYASRDAASGVQCISVATAADPAGPFVDTSTGPLVCQSALGGSIDPQPFLDADGTAYLYWKTNDGSSPLPASIWAAQLTPDGSALTSSGVPVLGQTQGWESTVEAPFMVQTTGGYTLLYSGGLWNGAGYGVGYALCQGPLGPCVKPQGAPILHSDRYRLGPGGESLVSDPSGNWWIAYDAWDGPSSAYSYAAGGFRSLWVAPVTFSGAVPQIGAGEAAEGYSLAGADGGLFAFGAADFDGSMGGRRLDAPVVGLAGDPATGGDTEAAADGGVFAFDAAFAGSMGGRPLAKPIVGMAATPDGGGYWLVASDGGIFAFGDAAFAGSLGGRPLAKPIVGMAAMPQGGGYWLVASDGGVFAFGEAQYFGSMGGRPLARPVVCLVPGPGGGGYWLVASDGGIFAFGDAAFLGSTGALRLAAPVVGATPA